MPSPLSKQFPQSLSQSLTTNTTNPTSNSSPTPQPLSLSQPPSSLSQSHSLTPPPPPAIPSVPKNHGLNSILVPAPDYSNPSSASSTSFQHEWPAADGGAPFPKLGGGNRRTEDIEMGSISPAGHRRRRSTLTAASMNASAVPSPATASRPRSQSIKNTAVSPESASLLESKLAEADGQATPDASSKNKNGKRTESYDDDSDFTDEDLHDDEETGLTRKDKRRKREKRRRNTRLDNRIARENLTEEERKEANQNVARKIIINGVLIGLWYFFSLSISLYNKWMFDSDRLNFAFPLFTTSFHMLVQFSLASLVLFFVPSLRPGSRSQRAESEPLMTKLFYLTRIGPCGAATGLDIGLGNTSLKFITLTFYTMCKSSSLAFVLIFAFFFKLETPTWRLVAIIATMTFGVVMMVAGEVEFNLGGFVLVISAAFFSGFRWGLTQILLLRNPATSNPFSSIFFLAPVMFVTLMAIAIPVEGFRPLFEGFKQLSTEWGAIRAPLILLFPGTIAFLMTASEFALLQRSSVVTLSIAGIFKEVVTISAAALVFDDRLTPINISGLVITILAIAFYNYIKLTKMRDEARLDAHAKSNAAYTAAATGSEDEDDSDDEETGFVSEREGDRSEGGASNPDFVTVDGDIIPTHGADESKPLRSEHND
ncbi:triose-phosphate transporter [Apiospora arundinis]|uniref:Triose-phosphate transporter n=1 Tax=Apiospora arundinis TaxID=335852 RepID=A0ABR2J5Y5_9PEZI